MPDYKDCLVLGNTLTNSISYYCLKHCTRMQGCSSFCNAKKVWALNLLPRKAQLVNRDRKLELPHHNPSTSAGDAHKKRPAQLDGQQPHGDLFQALCSAQPRTQGAKREKVERPVIAALHTLARIAQGALFWHSNKHRLGPQTCLFHSLARENFAGCTL